MALKEDRVTIGGRAFSIRQLPATKALKVELFIAKAIGEPLFKAFVAGQGTSAEAATAAAVGLLADRVNEDELLRILGIVFEYVGLVGTKLRICEGANPEGLDEVFAGRNRELWEVFVAALKVNFADFFQGALSLSSLREKIQQRAGATSSNQPTSTGESGDPAPVNNPSVL